MIEYSCPSCGNKLKSISIGWYCDKCDAYVDTRYFMRMKKKLVKKICIKQFAQNLMNCIKIKMKIMEIVFMNLSKKMV